MSKQVECGYGRPPVASRYPKGMSGNPKGRPRGWHNRPPYDAVLGQSVTIKEDGVERRVTAAEAFLLYMMKRGLVGDSAAARATMEAITEARQSACPGTAAARRSRSCWLGWSRVASRRLSRRCAWEGSSTVFRPSIRTMLEPWLVEAAVARLGGRRLSREEQATVLEATRTPRKVQWRGWWEVKQ